MSDGLAPTSSHFFISGAFRLVSFLSGSYHPSSCKVNSLHAMTVDRDVMSEQTHVERLTSSGLPSRLLRESTATSL